MQSALIFRSVYKVHVPIFWNWFSFESLLWHSVNTCISTKPCVCYIFGIFKRKSPKTEDQVLGKENRTLKTNFFFNEDIRMNCLNTVTSFNENYRRKQFEQKNQTTGFRKWNQILKIYSRRSFSDRNTVEFIILCTIHQYIFGGGRLSV